MTRIVSGTLTFVFTDVPASASLWEAAPEAMAQAMVLHDRLVEDAVVRTGGQMVRPRGESDGRFAVFRGAGPALIAAVEIVQAVTARRWPTPQPIALRVAIHSGDAERRDGDYYGSVVNRAARLRAIGHAGQILVSEAAATDATPALTARMELHDLGLHGLRDLSEPERVFQLLAPGLPRDFPPLRSMDPVRHNLPHQLGQFVGRDMELGELPAVLRARSLVTLVGPPGAGKTRLALHVAARLVTSYRDGVWLVELAESSAYDEVVDAIAAALGVPKREVATIGEVEDFLATRDLLLLLDGCDRCTVYVGAVVTRLLGAAPSVTVLATSRVPLGASLEHALVIDGLSYPDAVDNPVPEALAGYDAVRLFVDRAQAVRPGFGIDASNAAAVAELCARLRGIPGAVERIAMRMRALNPEQLLQRLSSDRRAAELSQVMDGSDVVKERGLAPRGKPER